MDPFTAACRELLKSVEGKNIPLTVNDANYKGVVFAYSGENWEVLFNAIRQAVDQVQESLLEKRGR
jgi:hypothetical protein